jgi:NADPH-dependent curcumin reductase CurA
LVKDKNEANEAKEVAEKPKPKATRVSSKKVLEEINQLDGKMDSLGTRVDSLAASMKAEQKVAAMPLQSAWLGLFVVGIAAAAVGTILLAISQTVVVGLAVVGIGTVMGAIASIRLWGKGYQK